MDFNEIKLSLVIVWIIISLIILMVLITPFIISPSTITNLVPACEWNKNYNKECLFCGMTTGFILISHGRFSEAAASNKFSPYLYVSFLLNELLLMLFMINKVYSRFNYILKI